MLESQRTRPLRVRTQPVFAKKEFDGVEIPVFDQLKSRVSTKASCESSAFAEPHNRVNTLVGPDRGSLAALL